MQYMRKQKHTSQNTPKCVLLSSLVELRVRDCDDPRCMQSTTRVHTAQGGTSAATLPDTLRGQLPCAYKIIPPAALQIGGSGCCMGVCTVPDAWHISNNPRLPAQAQYPE